MSDPVRPASPVGGAAAERAAVERERRRARGTPLLRSVPRAGAGGPAGPPLVPAARPAARPDGEDALRDALAVAAEVGEELARSLRADSVLNLREPAEGPEAVRPEAVGSQAVSEAQRRLADAVEFVRRRLAGEYEVDEFGFDRELTERVMAALLRPVYRQWFRVDVIGAENVPDDAAAMLVGNHSGTLAWDAVMTQFAVHDVTPSGRFLRMLGADLVFATPVMGDLARRMGATLASADDTERLLRAGHLVGVWPEGFKGIGKSYRDRYRLQRFGRGGFVASAIRSGVPIVPVSIVGAEEIYPMIADVRPLARLMGTPYWPVTPLWPWFGLLGLIPLPSKWLIDFGTPIRTDERDLSEADDPMVVFEITDGVREVIQQTLYSLLVRRPSVFS